MTKYILVKFLTDVGIAILTEYELAKETFKLVSFHPADFTSQAISEA